MKRKKLPKILFIFFLFLLILNILFVVSPMLLPHDTVHNLDGYVGSVEHDFDEMPFPMNLIYLSGDFVCHQKEERSFALNDNQMPCCSRCIAISIGLIIGVVIILFYRIVPDLGFLMLFGISLLPIAMDGLGQMFGHWESTNIIRAVTGFPPGVMSGLAVGVIYDEFILWRNKKNGRKPQFENKEETN